MSSWGWINFVEGESVVHKQYVGDHYRKKELEKNAADYIKGNAVPEEFGEKVEINLQRDWDYIVLTMASNTTDAGDGIVYEWEDGELQEQEKYQGYEGACGHDVEGRIEDDYGFRPKVSRGW